MCKHDNLGNWIFSDGNIVIIDFFLNLSVMSGRLYEGHFLCFIDYEGFSNYVCNIKSLLLLWSLSNLRYLPSEVTLILGFD